MLLFGVSSKEWNYFWDGHYSAQMYLTPISPTDLTHLPQVPYARVDSISIGLDNGLSPIRRQAIF